MKTSTIDDYFLKLLKSVGADLKDKTDLNLRVDENYLKYVYSPAFEEELDKKLAKGFDLHAFQSEPDK